MKAMDSSMEAMNAVDAMKAVKATDIEIRCNVPQMKARTHTEKKKKMYGKPSGSHPMHA